MRRNLRLLAALATGVVAACAGATTPDDNKPPTNPPPPPPKPAAIAIVAGADQSADVDAVLPVRIAVRVDDAAGKPIAGVAVTFAAAAGGARIDGASQTTDASGTATVGNVTLGPTPTSNEIVVTAGDITAPTIVASGKWTSRLSSGAAATCAIVSSKVQCWGEDGTAQLAVLPTQFPQPPAGASPNPILPPPLNGLTTIGSSGGNGFCGATAAGWACWGFGRAFGRTDFPVTPITMGNGIQWTEVSYGRNSSCGVNPTGVGYCWGLNQRGEIGSASAAVGPVATTPVPVDGGLSFKTIAVGWVHACGLSTDGTAYCWGNNTYGELGIGAPDTVAHKTPSAVQTAEKFVQLSLGARYTCGITVARKAMCWGRNATGQLGDGGTTDHAVPTPVAGGFTFTRIAAASKITFDSVAKTNHGNLAHTCALTDAGTAYCWGLNANGQLGDGTQIDRLLPTLVAGGRSYSAIDTNDEATCAMRGNNIWCWGRNDRGQIGDGTFDNVKRIPTAVNLIP